MKALKKREQLPADLPKEEPNHEIEKGDFDKFPISEASKATLRKTGINYLFPIQYNTFMPIFEGQDLVGKDRTGSGKTLAFALPILEKLRAQKTYFVNSRGQAPYIVVLIPTRELCIQVTKEFQRFMNFENEYRIASIYGGTEIYPQIDLLRSGVEVMIGTPGRIIDLMERKAFSFKSLTHFILDETDQMLNIGFQDDIDRILKSLRREFEENQKPFDKLQVVLFSATIPRWVEQVANKFMKPNPVFIDMIKNSETKTSKTVEHLSLCFATRDHKIEAIGDLVLVYGGSHCRTIIFTDTKDEANEVALKGQLKIECQVLHGDIPQKQREVTFASFRNGSLKCLVATNVAARGLDIPEVDLIVQLSPPKEIDTYIHRSGRTGRAGKTGTCITFFTKRQQELMDRIEAQANIKFKKIGAPQPTDIMRSNARDISCSFDNVSNDVLVYFQENVKSILEKYEPEEAISRALAVISGYTKSVQQRSLLSSVEGFVTYQMETDSEVRSASFFWNILRKHCSPALTDNIKNMRFLKNHKGVVFDLKEDDKKLFDEICKTLSEDGTRIFVATELPEFEERTDFGSGQNNYSNGRGGYEQNGRGQSNGYRGQNDRYGGRNGQSARNIGSDFGSNGTPARSSGGKDDCKLFIGNIPFDLREGDFTELCKTKGLRPTEVYMGKNPDGSSKGFGIMRFSDSRTTKDAMEELSKIRLGNRSLRVDFADRR